MFSPTKQKPGSGQVKLSMNIGVSLDPIRTPPKTSPVSRASSRYGFGEGQALFGEPTHFSPSKLRDVIHKGDDRAVQYLRSLPLAQLKQAQLWIGLCSYPGSSY